MSSPRLGPTEARWTGYLRLRDVYPQLISYMQTVDPKAPDMSESGKIRVGWGRRSGEAGGLFTESYLAADGIENVIRVLEDMEDQEIFQSEIR